MSIVDKAASKRGTAGRSSLVERAMARGKSGAQAEVAEGVERSETGSSAAKPGIKASADAAPVARVEALEQAPESARRRPEARKTSRRFRLDWQGLERDRLIGTSRHARRLQSEIRTIKSRLMATIEFFDYRRGMRGRGGENVILMTSARQGEGKSFTAINLALSLALEDGVQVLLVDADPARRSVTGFFGLGRDSKGLLDRLGDPGMDLGEVLWRAEGAPLSVLPVGRPTARSADLFGSPAMTRLLDELSNRYPDRLILFDAAPILATNDPMVLSKQIQQVLLVVEAGKTTEATIRTALDVLGQRERVSLVLNHCTIRGDDVQATTYGYGQDVNGDATAAKGQEAA